MSDLERRAHDLALLVVSRQINLGTIPDGAVEVAKAYKPIYKDILGILKEDNIKNWT